MSEEPNEHLEPEGAETEPSTDEPTENQSDVAPTDEPEEVDRKAVEGEVKVHRPEVPDDDPETRVITLEAELASLNDKLLRALAENENVRRRAIRDKEDASKYAIASFTKEILSVADNISRAQVSIEEEMRNSAGPVANLIVGLEMTERGLLNTLERVGVTPIKAMGERFDHNLHEAMFEIEDKVKPAGTVLQVLETGYLLKDRLLRPAKVGVTKGGPKAPPPGAVGAETSADPAVRDGQAAYEERCDGPGSQLDENL